MIKPACQPVSPSPDALANLDARLLFASSSSWVVPDMVSSVVSARKEIQVAAKCTRVLKGRHDTRVLKGRYDKRAGKGAPRHHRCSPPPPAQSLRAVPRHGHGPRVLVYGTTLHGRSACAAAPCHTCGWNLLQRRKGLRGAQRRWLQVSVEMQDLYRYTIVEEREDGGGAEF